MTDKFGDWKFYPEDEPEKEGFYFVPCRNKDNSTLSLEKKHIMMERTSL